MALFVAVVALVVIAGVVARRASVQAALVAELKRNGGTALYSHTWWTYDDERPPMTFVPWSVRKRLGDNVCSDVFMVGAVPSRRKAAKEPPLTPEQTAAICTLARRFPKLRGFSIRSDSFEFRQIAAWPHLSQLKVLSIDSPNLTDDDLAAIGRLTGLSELTLVGSSITDEGVKQLAGLTQLGSLRLTSPRITDTGILSLPPLTRLQVLGLNGTQVGDNGAAALARSSRLFNVSLADTQVSDACLPALAKCPRLSGLELDGTKVTDAGLASLAGSRVEFLGLNNTSVTDAGLRHLGQMQNLNELHLRDTQISGEALEVLQDRERFRSIDVSGAPLTRAGLTQILKLPASEVILERTPIGDEELMLFLAADHLEKLDVRGTKVTVAGVREFLDACDARVKEELRLYGSQQRLGPALITDYGLEQTHPELFPEATTIPGQAQDDVSPVPSAP